MTPTPIKHSIFLLVVLFYQVVPSRGDVPIEYKNPGSDTVEFVLDALGDARGYWWRYQPTLVFEIQDPLLETTVNKTFSKAFAASGLELYNNLRKEFYICVGDKDYLNQRDALSKVKIDEGYWFQPKVRGQKSVIYINVEDRSEEEVAWLIHRAAMCSLFFFGDDVDDDFDSILNKDPDSFTGLTDLDLYLIEFRYKYIPHSSSKDEIIDRVKTYWGSNKEPEKKEPEKAVTSTKIAISPSETFYSGPKLLSMPWLKHPEKYKGRRITLYDMKFSSISRNRAPVKEGFRAYKIDGIYDVDLNTHDPFGGDPTIPVRVLKKLPKAFQKLEYVYVPERMAETFKKKHFSNDTIIETIQNQLSPTENAVCWVLDGHWVAVLQ